MCSFMCVLRIHADTGWNTFPVSSHDRFARWLKTTATPCTRLTMWPECRIILPLMAVVPSPVKRDSDRPKTSMCLSSIMLRRVVGLLLHVPRVSRERTFEEAMMVLPLALNAALGSFVCF